VSIAASLCAGISFLVWISLIAKGDLTWFPLLSKKPTLLIQAGLGILILTGSLASLVLAIYRPVYKGGEYQRRFTSITRLNPIFRYFKTDFNNRSGVFAASSNNSRGTYIDPVRISLTLRSSSVL
jgi:hypothetical protein